MLSERIHQAQGAAVKAKKSLQKPKTPKLSHVIMFRNYQLVNAQRVINSV